MKLVNGYIALEVERKPEKNSRGLFVIPEVQDISAIVALIADGVELVKVGDKVFYGRDFIELKTAGKEYLVMKEENIIAVEPTDVKREVN